MNADYRAMYGIASADRERLAAQLATTALDRDSAQKERDRAIAEAALLREALAAWRATDAHGPCPKCSAGLCSDFDALWDVWEQAASKGLNSAPLAEAAARVIAAAKRYVSAHETLGYFSDLNEAVRALLALESQP